MVLELKITCVCHQAKVTIFICCQMPWVAQNLLREVFNVPNPNLQSDLLSDHSRHTNFKIYQNANFYKYIGFSCFNFLDAKISTAYTFLF